MEETDRELFRLKRLGVLKPRSNEKVMLAVCNAVKNLLHSIHYIPTMPLIFELNIHNSLRAYSP